jgi:hypothetical protein
VLVPAVIEPEQPIVPQSDDVPVAAVPDVAGELQADVPQPAEAAPPEPEALSPQIDDDLPPQPDPAPWPPRSYRPVVVEPVPAQELTPEPTPKPGSGRSGITVEVPSARKEPVPPPSRRTRITYGLVGLLGVMLFAGALVSMFRQANVANLVAGLVGVAFMAPAAGYFLFSVLARDEGEGAGLGI